MSKWGILGKLLVIWVVLFSSPAFAQEGMTDLQNLILRQTLSAGGSLTKEMHEKFWSELPKATDEQWIHVFRFLLQSSRLGQLYQRALWQSALISYEQNKVIYTESPGESEKAFSKLFAESAPFAKGSAEYDAFANDYTTRLLASKENAKRLLDAAASHQDLKAVNGETTKIDEMLIKTVLEGLDASFERLNLLLDPVWRGG